MERNKKKTKIVAILLIIFNIIIVLCVISFFIGSDQKIKNRITANKAINYFSDKYNIRKKDIKIDENGLDYCLKYTDSLYINYNNKEFIIKYNEHENYFGDNYQYDQVYRDFLDYLNTKFNYVNEIKINRLYDSLLETPERYDGNIKDYIRNLKGVAVYIWIEAKNKDEAYELNQKYSNAIVTELEELKVNYKIVFSTNEIYDSLPF